jgi:hypothetical protein
MQFTCSSDKLRVFNSIEVHDALPPPPPRPMASKETLMQEKYILIFKKYM